MNLSSTFAFICFLALAIYINPASSDENDSMEFLAAHNEARARVGVRDLTWSKELEDLTKNKADQVLKTNTCDHLRKSYSGFLDSLYPYGENLAAATGFPDPTASQMVGYWLREKSDFDYPKCKPGKYCGDYTQVVWKGTRYLGCAKVKCESGLTYAVCIYYPKGNIEGELPYYIRP